MKLEFSELLRRKLGPLVLRGLSGEQPDWGSFRLKYNSLSQKCRFYGIFASCLRATRSAALTVHRTVIHYRRLRFAYPQNEGAEGGCAAKFYRRGVPRAA